MTSTVSLDPVDFEAAADNFNQIQLSAVLRLGSLSRELRQFDNMAGTDSGGQAFAAEYDANAMTIVQALDYLAIRASEFDYGLTATASEHYLAEQAAAGNVGASSIFTPRPVFAGENPSPPPSAFGGDPTPPPEPWGTVKEFIGAMWPDANIETLNRAAATWRRIGENLDEVAREVRRADNPLAATRSGEVAAIRDRVAELADTIALIAGDADEVGASCEEYAGIVHAAHEEVFAMLRQLALEIIAGIGIGVALSFFTFGAAGAAATGVLAARIVSVAARITQTILKVLSFAQKAAGRFAAVHGRLVAAVARLSPRSQTMIRVGNQVVAETSAAVFSEGVVRGENANYLSAFAGGFVGAGTTAGVLSIFGRRADTVLANVVGGTAGGFTGSVAASGVMGNISVESLILGTVMGTAGGTLGGGGSGRSGTDAVAPTPTGQQATASSNSAGGGSSSPQSDAPATNGSGSAPVSQRADATTSPAGSTSTSGRTPTLETPASATSPTAANAPDSSQVDPTANGARPESGDVATSAAAAPTGPHSSADVAGTDAPRAADVATAVEHGVPRDGSGTNGTGPSSSPFDEGSIAQSGAVDSAPAQNAATQDAAASSDGATPDGSTTHAVAPDAAGSDGATSPQGAASDAVAPVGATHEATPSETPAAGNAPATNPNPPRVDPFTSEELARIESPEYATALMGSRTVPYYLRPDATLGAVPDPGKPPGAYFSMFGPDAAQIKTPSDALRYGGFPDSIRAEFGEWRPDGLIEPRLNPDGTAYQPRVFGISYPVDPAMFPRGPRVEDAVGNANFVPGGHTAVLTGGASPGLLMNLTINEFVIDSGWRVPPRAYLWELGAGGERIAIRRF